MNTTAAAYRAAERPLTAVVDTVPADRWADPSPCEGWSARDVLKHMIDTQREFLAGHGVDLTPVPDLEADPASAWREHVKRVGEVVEDDTLVATTYDGHFGPTTVAATLEQFYIWDMVVHRWDVARSVGGDTRLTDDEIDRIEQGAKSFGDALTMDGVCKPAVEPAPDADRQSRVLAALGRKV